MIPACGANPLNLLTGGGTNVAANVPIAAGREVEQTQGISVKTEAPSVSLRPKSRVDTVDQSVTNNISLEPWVLLVIVCLAAGGAIGWVDNITRLFKRTRNG